VLGVAVAGLGRVAATVGVRVPAGVTVGVSVVSGTTVGN
jgi:hypothetical protein